MQSNTKYNETFHFTFCYSAKSMFRSISNITLLAKVSSRGDSTNMNQNPSECMYTNIFVYLGENQEFPF